MRYLDIRGVNMRRGRSGQLLILVLGVMGLGLLVVAPLLAYLDTSFKINMHYQIKTESYLAAEAGIERVIGDLYMGTDIRLPTYETMVNQAPAVLSDLYFEINVTEPTTLGVAPLAVESDLDPGSCLGMRPIDAGDVWDYDFFLSHGEDIKVSWPYYTGDSACNPYKTSNIEKGWTVISLLDEYGAAVTDLLGNPIRSEVGASGTLGDDARMVVNTLYVQGAYPGPDGERGTADDDIIIEGGPYTLRFENKATSGGSDVRVCCPPFKGGDYDYVLSGSINCSEMDCSHFIDDSGMVSGGGIGGGAVMLFVFNENFGDATGSKAETNTDTFSCDYVELNITKWDGSVSTYTYNNTDPFSGPHFSRYNAITTDPGGDDGSTSSQPYDEGYYDEFVTAAYAAMGPPGTGTALGGPDIEAISHREGQRFDVPSPVGGELNAVLMHIFSGVNNSAEVARIDVRWEGYQHKRAETADAAYNYQADDDELSLFILNWDPDGDPAGAGTPVMHYLDHREQGGGFIWLKLYQGAYRDYLVRSIAFRDQPGGIDGQLDAGEEMALVTTYLRQSPGPSVWWEEQAMEIMSWHIEYYTQ
jgi:hypothetical protein